MIIEERHLVERPVGTADLAGEIKWNLVLLADGLACIHTDVKRLIQGNAVAHRALDLDLGDPIYHPIYLFVTHHSVSQQ